MLGLFSLQTLDSVVIVIWRRWDAQMLETKQQSWVSLVGWVASFPDGQWKPWKTFLLPLLHACLDAGLDQHFRIGQSMAHIIFSTAEEHGLENYDPQPPRVTLMFDEAQQRWAVASSYCNLHFAKPDRQNAVNAENVLPVLESYLADLWREMRPDEAMPPPLDNKRRGEILRVLKLHRQWAALCQPHGFPKRFFDSPFQGCHQGKVSSWNAWMNCSTGLPRTLATQSGCVSTQSRRALRDIGGY